MQGCMSFATINAIASTYEHPSNHTTTLEAVASADVLEGPT